MEWAINFCFASSKDKNQLTIKNSSRKLPLKDSINGLSVGFPGLESSGAFQFMVMEVVMDFKVSLSSYSGRFSQRIFSIFVMRELNYRIKELTGQI